MRKFQFAEGEYYHVYNRGVDKRQIFIDKTDFYRFVRGLRLLNTERPLGGLYEIFLGDKRKEPIFDSSAKPLVKFVAYCINPNHFHLILEPVCDEGIPRFMHRFSTGYTKYFNGRYKRTGSLFGGRYKATHVDSGEYLLNLSAYVNLNYKIHGINADSSFVASSWDQYAGNEIKNKDLFIPCTTDIVLGQSGGPKGYKKFAEECAEEMAKRKEEESSTGLS